MSNDRSARESLPTAPSREAGAAAWLRPSFEVIPLDCEITAYAPDGDSPLY
jgi:hypothetical protein